MARTIFQHIRFNRVTINDKSHEKCYFEIALKICFSFKIENIMEKYCDWLKKRISCGPGVRRSAGSLREFTVDENFEGDRAAERKGGGSGSEEAAGSGSTCSRPNRAIGAGLDEGGQFTRLFGCSSGETSGRRRWQAISLLMLTPAKIEPSRSVHFPHSFLPFSPFQFQLRDTRIYSGRSSKG